MITLLTSSLYHATQVKVYGMDFTDVISVGLETMFSVVLAENGYRAENGRSSIASLVESCKVWFPDWREILYIVENVGPDDVYFGKPWCKITLSDIQEFGNDMVEAFSWAFDASSVLTEDGYKSIKSIVDYYYSPDSEFKIFTDGGITISRMMRECMNYILKAKGVQETPGNLPYVAFADFWAETAGTISYEQFLSCFSSKSFYFCGYDSENKKYFVLPLQTDYVYLFGPSSSGYAISRFTDINGFSGLISTYNSGRISFADLMDSGSFSSFGYGRFWSLGPKSKSDIKSNYYLNSINFCDTERVETYFRSQNVTVGSDFDKCYIVSPAEKQETTIVNFYALIDEKVVCISKSNRVDITSLAASSSALAGITLGNSDLKVGLGTLETIQSRLQDELTTSDDIADIVAKANADVIGSIENTGSSISSAIKSLPRTIFDAFAGTLTVIVEGIADIIDGITGLPSAMYNFFKGILELIHNCLVNIQNAVIRISSEVVDGVKEGLKILFVPKSVDLSIFSDNIPVMHTIQSVKGLFDSVTSVSNIVSQEAPKVTLYLGASSVPYFKSVGNVTVIDFKDFEKPIYNMNVSIIGLVRIVTGFFSLYVWGRWFLNSIPRMLRGYTTYSMAYDKFSERK